MYTYTVVAGPDAGALGYVLEMSPTYNSKKFYFK